MEVIEVLICFWTFTNSSAAIILLSDVSLSKIDSFDVDFTEFAVGVLFTL